MCGIVGHIGPQNSLKVVLDGLKKLEYRGYDSAGVSFIDENNKMHLYKKEGKLDNLLEAVSTVKSTHPRACIGHTRWATHGEVNDVNSHPHQSGTWSIVHNGIIENANGLREELTKDGFEFKSQTDSEVFLGLMIREKNRGSNFKLAFSNAFKMIEGNSAIVALDGENSEILAAKRGAPLVCGINEKGSEVLASSDPYALVGLVDKIYFPNDEIVCSLGAKNKHLLKFFDLNGKASKDYQSKKQNLKSDVQDKGSYEHFMLKEIHEQPELIRSLCQYYLGGEGENDLSELNDLNFKRVHIVACGTAYYAGLVVRDYLEGQNKIPCVDELASEFRYRGPLFLPGDAALFISQSGETADTLAAQNLCKENNIPTISLVNVDGSTLYRECDHNLLIRAGVEIGVASTKAFTQMALTGRLMSAFLSGEVKDEGKKSELVKKFNLLASRFDDLLENTKLIQDIAFAIHNSKGFFFTGRHHYYPTALEGALKLKEIAYVHAEGYAAGELKHGPIALIDEGIVNIAIVGPELYAKTVSNVQEIKARRGQILAIGPINKKNELEKIADYFIPLEFEDLEELAPLLVNGVNQLVAYYIAKFKGTDIDRPRNLAKSVTVE